MRQTVRKIPAGAKNERKRAKNKEGRKRGDAEAAQEEMSPGRDG